MMTKNEKLRTVLFVIIGLLIGFTAGVLVKNSGIDGNSAKGTISKVNNYRNVKITDEDIKLRSELLSDSNIYNGYKNYFNFHYITASAMTSALESAIKASEGLADFKNMNGELIDGLKSYYNSMGQLRSEIMIAIAFLSELGNADPSDVYMAIENANTSISQMNYKDNSVIFFLDEAGRYLSSKNGNNLQLFNKAYSHLLTVQGVKAAAVKDKPRMKYLSEKQLTASVGELHAFDKDNLSLYISNDISGLKEIEISESDFNLEAIFRDMNLDFVISNLIVSNEAICAAVFESENVLVGCFMDYSNLNLDQTGVLNVFVPGI
ncbi:MAG: hypothetical protein KA807_09780 [Prolixibacteraceae bacterium]|nr:hypothetical protein [Prolixibacteraceae bacterium]